MTQGRKRGLVLSGGAALGAFQAGALITLSQRGLEFEAIAAASIGLLHALAWNRGPQFVQRLDQTWREDVARFSPFEPGALLEFKSPFKFRGALTDLVAKYRDDHPDADAPGQVPIYVALTEALSGEPRGYCLSAPELDAETREAVLRAAVSIPPLGDRAVEINGERLYDGGFSNNAPIRLLDELNLDEIWLIDLTPTAMQTPLRRGLAQSVDRLRQRQLNPWITGAAAMAKSRLGGPGRKSHTRIVRIAYDPRGLELLLRGARGLTFSQRNIDRLLALGREQAQRVWDQYFSG
ncbi:MAG: patatin-like phospholipase family protein [Candidatus Alcyoniella australis]|nr:patatin-like phospholipase family protein [Candidatus Alcyoniella australis]